MIKYNKTRVSILLVVTFFSLQAIFTLDVIAAKKKSDSDTLNSFINKVLTSHESLILAKLNIVRTKSEIQIIESTLGWNLFANAGINRDRSFIGAKTTQSSVSLGVNKLLQSGNSVELKSSYIRDDSEFSFGQTLPNPISTTGVDLNYRIPLMQNKIHNEYQLDINSANTNYLGSVNSQSIIRDDITSQAIDLFYGAAILVARLDTARKSIKRSQKLKAHIEKNIQLGILEKGEVLQADAQIYNLQGQYEELVLVWEKSKIAINRLIGKSWDNSFTANVSETPIYKYNLENITQAVKNYSPALNSLNLNLKLADSIITLNRDNTKSKLDVVFSVGTLNTEGPSNSGQVDDSDVIGGIRFEYRKALDSRGLDSQLYQSEVDKNTIQTQITKLELDLKYDTYSLVSDIKQISKVNDRYKKRNQSEKLKFEDIVNRYRAGRADTNLVIKFENELTQAELIYKTQNLLREKAISLLALKQGTLLDSNLYQYKVEK